MDVQLTARAEEILTSVQFPPQPKILFSIQEETKKKVANFDVISALLSRDIALSARVIKLVNSPLFGLGQKITSIKHGLSILGLDSFSKFVVTSAILEVQKNRFSADQRILEHGMVAAHIARQVVQRVSFLGEGVITPDTAYLCGLFHDCAIPLLVMKFKEYASVVDAELGQQGNLSQLEERCAGTNHGVVGRLVSRSWYLPPVVGEAIMYHHDPDFPNSLDNLDAIKLTAVLQLSDYLANRFAFNSGAVKVFNMQQWSHADWDKKNENVLFELGLDTDDVASLESECNVALSDMLWD